MFLTTHITVLREGFGRFNLELGLLVPLVHVLTGHVTRYSSEENESIELWAVKNLINTYNYGAVRSNLSHDCYKKFLNNKTFLKNVGQNPCFSYLRKGGLSSFVLGWGVEDLCLTVASSTEIGREGVLASTFMG